MYKEVAYMVKLIIYVCLSMHFLNCQGEATGNAEKSTQELQPEGRIEVYSESLQPNATVVLDSILDTVHYVALETNDSCIIGRIDEIVITKDHVFILDIHQTKSIYIFDRQGRFRKLISRIGRGPGEYMQPADIAICEVRNEIYLLNEFPAKILIYNFNGEFIGEIELPFRFSSFALIDDCDLVFINEPNYRKYGNPPGKINTIFSTLFYLSADGISFEGGGPLQTAFEDNIISNGYFGLMKNIDIIYHPLFNDTIFEIRKSKSFPLLVVDFNEHSIDIEEVAGLNRDEFLEACDENGYYYMDGHYSHTKDFITFFIRSVKEDAGYLTIYNRHNGDYMTFLNWHSTLFNPCNLIAKTSWREYFVSIIPASRIVKMRRALKPFSDIPADDLVFTPSDEILNIINEYSNPVLAFYKFRPEKINMESVFYE